MAFDRSAFKSDAVDLGRQHFGDQGPQVGDDVDMSAALAKLQSGEGDISDEELEALFSNLLDICGDDSDDSENDGE